MNVVKDLRRAAEVTQAELAEAAGTSQPTVAAYESGRTSPTLRTVERLARSLGRDLVVSFVPALTREDRRSLFLHRAVADKVRREPDAALARARRNLERMREMHPGAVALFDEWERILRQPVDHIAVALVDPRMYARDLRQVTPFAGVLSARERARVYSDFAKEEAVR